MLSTLVIALFGVNATTYIVSIVFTVVGTAFAFEGIMKVWAQKSFPTLLRATAQGIIIAVARFFAALVATAQLVSTWADGGSCHEIEFRPQPSCNDERPGWVAGRKPLTIGGS